MINPTSPSPGLRNLLRHIAMDSDAGAANNVDGSSAETDKIDPNDDVLTQLYKFLAGKISDDDMAKLEQILHPELGYDGPWPVQTAGTPLPPAGTRQGTPSRLGAPLSAMDATLNAAGRRVRARLAVANRADMLKRFPQAGRLRQGF